MRATCRVPILWKYLSGMPRTSLLYRISSWEIQYCLIFCKAKSTCLETTILIFCFSISSKTGFTCLSFSMSTDDGSLASPTKVLTKYRTWAKTSHMSKMFSKRTIGIALTWRSNWGKGQIWKENLTFHKFDHLTWTGKPTKARVGWAMLIRCL